MAAHHQRWMYVFPLQFIALSNILQIEANENLQTIFNELSDHMDSIHGNISQVQGITEAITKSKAAVQATLFNHLESDQYENVVLG